MSNEPGVPPQPMLLSYAPPERGRLRIWWVIACGLFTTVVTLTVDYFLSTQANTYVMGWYADYVIPAGAVLLGLAASSGYALASLVLGVRVRRRLLVSILVLMLLAYFGSDYIEFKARGPLIRQVGTQMVPGPNGKPVEVPILQPVGFWHYFHLNAVNFAWKKENDSNATEAPLGMAGYFFVGLAIAGFSLSGLILPAALGKRAYCELCQRYMGTQSLALLPGSMPAKKFSKKQSAEQQQYQQLHQEELTNTQQRLKRMAQCARGNDAAGFVAVLREPTPPKKQVSKLPRRISVKIVSCASCKSGSLVTASITGQGKQIRTTPMAKQPLDPHFVHGTLEQLGMS